MLKPSAGRLPFVVTWNRVKKNSANKTPSIMRETSDSMESWVWAKNVTLANRLGMRDCTQPGILTEQDAEGLRLPKEKMVCTLQPASLKEI
jgi:hypothetical protein